MLVACLSVTTLSVWCEEKKEDAKEVELADAKETIDQWLVYYYNIVK